MKRILSLFLTFFVVLTLSSCGTGGEDGDSSSGNNNNGGYSDDSDYNNDYSNSNSIYISNLRNGYIIKGRSSKDEDVTLTFYSDGTYDYERNNEYFYGNFDIVDVEVQMRDGSGSYVLDSENGILKEGYSYFCNALGRKLTISSIESIN